MNHKITNVLHVITNLDVGGAENLILSIAKNMNRENYKAMVCCISHAGILAPEFEKIGAPVISLGLMKKKGWDNKIITGIAELIKKEKVDFVHTHITRIYSVVLRQSAVKYHR